MSWQQELKNFSPQPQQWEGWFGQCPSADLFKKFEKFYLRSSTNTGRGPAVLSSVVSTSACWRVLLHYILACSTWHSIWQEMCLWSMICVWTTQPCPYDTRCNACGFISPSSTVTTWQLIHICLDTKEFLASTDGAVTSIMTAWAILAIKQVIIEWNLLGTTKYATPNVPD